MANGTVSVKLRPIKLGFLVHVNDKAGLLMECLQDTSVANALRKILPNTIEEITDIPDKPRKNVVQAFRLASGIKEN